MPRRTLSFVIATTTTCVLFACSSSHDSANNSDPTPSPSQTGQAGQAAGSTATTANNATTTTSTTPEGVTGTQASPLKLRRTLGVVLYPSFELLDVYGPVEMFAYVGIQLSVVMVAEKAGPVTSATGERVLADFGFDDAPALDLVMVPGGVGTVPELADSTLLDFLRARAKDAELVTSVCTGSAILARAGLLDGYNATSNKRFFSLARAAGPNVNWIEKARWVEDRNRFTSSGVSAGIDMSLAVIARLWGTDAATTIARNAEYIWNSDPTVDPFFVP